MRSRHHEQRDTTKPIRVLHICNWLPNRLGPHEVPFILRHINALAPWVEQRVWHVEVRPATGRTRFFLSGPHADRTFLLAFPTQRWRLIEWLTLTFLLFAWWTRDRRQRFDLVNVHIAYPLLVRTRFLTKLFGLPVVITEHWSAYHFNFGTSGKGLDRIRSIFGRGIPLITVSQALRRDIERFSGIKQDRSLVIDNVVEGEHFEHIPAIPPQEGRFFCAMGWRHPKRPDVLFETLVALRDRGSMATLRMAGSGPGMQQALARIHELGLQDSVELLGQLTSAEIADEIRQAHALLHCSDYETYSAICAEALVCGTPVIASAVGGITEYLDDTVGIPVPDNEVGTWTRLLIDNWQRMLLIDRKKVSTHMRERTSSYAVGRRYRNALISVLDDASPLDPVQRPSP